MDAQLNMTALVPSEPPAAVKAAPLALTKKMTVEQAFRCILRNCLEQITANQAGVAHGGQPEALHQMRVGLRRLRSAVNLFRRVLHLPPELRQEVDWLSGALGAARDWDVLSGSTLPQVLGQVPSEPELLLVQQAAERRADELRAAAADAIGTERYSALMLNLARWEHSAGWRDFCTMEQLRELKEPASGFARAALKRAQRRLLKRGAGLTGARHGSPSAEQRHRVRIAAKKTRYTTEFFQSLYERKRVRPFVRALTALQDELGWLNDAAVADGLLKTWPDSVAAGDARQDGAAAFLRGYLASSSLHDDRKLRKLWGGFEQLKLPA